MNQEVIDTYAAARTQEFSAAGFAEFRDMFSNTSPSAQGTA